MPRFSIRRKARVGPPKPEPAKPAEPKEEEKVEEDQVFDDSSEPEGFAEAFAAHAAQGGGAYTGPAVFARRDTSTSP